jgi:hypothetical protein
MSFFGDLGQFTSDLFTGRWTGGQTNVVQDVQQDPWVLAAPAAAVAAPFVAPEIAAAIPAVDAAAPAVDLAAVTPSIDASAAIPDFALSSQEVDAFGSPLPTTAGGSSISGGSAALSGGAPPLNLGGATPPAGTGAPPGGSGWWNTLTSPSQWTLPGVAQAAGVTAGLGGLGLNLMKGNPAPGPQNQMTNVGGAAMSQFQLNAANAQTLEQPLLTGTLPPSAQAGIQQWVNATKAKIVSGYGARGQPTAPGTNSALDQDLANVDQQALAMQLNYEQTFFAAGQQLQQTAYNNLALDESTQAALANLNLSSTANLNQSIATLASAMVGGKGGFSLNTNTQPTPRLTTTT